MCFLGFQPLFLVLENHPLSSLLLHQNCLCSGTPCKRRNINLFPKRSSHKLPPYFVHLQSIEADDSYLLWPNSRADQLFYNFQHQFCLARVLKGTTQRIIRTFLSHLSLGVIEKELFPCRQQRLNAGKSRKRRKGLSPDARSSLQTSIVECVTRPPHDRLGHPVLCVEHLDHAAALELLDQPLHQAHPQNGFHLRVRAHHRWRQLQVVTSQHQLCGVPGNTLML